MTKDERIYFFRDECKNSLKNQNNLKEVAAHLYYYDNQYAIPIKQYFTERGIESKELEFKNGSPFIPMCSLCSSARLCFLYFYNSEKRDAYLYEQSYPIVKKNGNVLTSAHPDAIDGDYYYECKCQEIVNGENEKLKKSYLKSAKFFEELFFDLNNIKEEGDYLSFDFEELGIDLDCKYYETQIDVKQLICHILALANRVEKTKRAQHLQYIIFVPDNYKEMRDIYDSLTHEIDMIFVRENNLTKFGERHNIIIEHPRFVKIGDIYDPFVK